MVEKTLSKQMYALGSTMSYGCRKFTNNGNFIKYHVTKASSNMNWLCSHEGKQLSLPSKSTLADTDTNTVPGDKIFTH